MSMNTSDGTSEVLVEKKVGILLFIGIFLMPYIFGWLVAARKGYSSTAKVLTIVWMVVLTFGAFSAKNDKKSEAATSESAKMAVASASESAPPPAAKPVPQAPTPAASSRMALQEAIAESRTFEVTPEQVQDTSIVVEFSNGWMIWTQTTKRGTQVHKGRVASYSSPDRNCWGFSEDDPLSAVANLGKAVAVQAVNNFLLCEYVRTPGQLEEGYSFSGTPEAYKRTKGDWIAVQSNNVMIKSNRQYHLEFASSPRG